MPYGLRFTRFPEQDVERNWTGLQGQTYETEQDAFQAFFYNEAASWQGEYERDWAAYNEDAPEVFWDCEEFVERKLRGHAVPQTRQLPNGTWTVVDHEGLGVWPLWSDPRERTQPANDEDARTIAERELQRARADFNAGELGWSTVGAVRYVGPVGVADTDAHLYWSADMLPEDAVRAW